MSARGAGPDGGIAVGAPHTGADGARGRAVVVVGEGRPPRVIEVDGVRRKRAREIDLEEGLRLSGRGLRAFLVTPSTAAEVSREEFRTPLSERRDVFELGPGDPVPAAFLHVYGRRRGSVDDRVLVASVAQGRPV